MKIRSLRPNVTEAEAAKVFEGSGLSGLLRHLRGGPLQRLALVYIPFRIFKVSVHNSGRREERTLAMDAVSGTLDLYTFGQEPETISVETRNLPSARLEPGLLEERLKEKVRRTLFRRGFFQLRDLRLEVEALSDEICVPYWVGFRGHSEQARMEVLDAVRRSPEGGKVRRVIEQWLAE